MLRWILSISVLLSLSMASNVAADPIKTLSKRLAKSRSEKVRMSAALSLAKINDARAMQALMRSLSKDKSSAIRKISAVSIGQSLKNGARGNTRKKAIATLKRTVKSDRSSQVRSAAKVALAKASLGGARSSGRAKGILVVVNIPKLSKRLPAKTGSLLRTTVQNAIRDKAVRSVKAAGNRVPSGSQLQRSGIRLYSVSPSIAKLKLQRNGRGMVVECQIKMRVSPAMVAGANIAIEKTATVSGSGSVISGSSRNAIANSSQACIEAVVAQVTSNQVVPFLAAKAR